MVNTLRLIQPDANIAATLIGNVGVSTDGLGTDDLGLIQAEIPEGSEIEFAFLHVATRTSGNSEAFQPEAIGFGSTTVPITFLGNVDDSGGDINFETGRADVTSIVSDAVDDSGGIFDFLVDETITGNPDAVEGTSLTVIYSNPTLPTRTIAVLEGGLTGPDVQTNILQLGSPLDTLSANFTAEMALGIQFGFPRPAGQFSIVDINGNRLTSSAGNADDSSLSSGEDGNLITVGGIGDSTVNPNDPFSNDLSLDDELYDLTPFLESGDTAIRLDTSNPSDDDSIFLVVLDLPGIVSVDQPIADNAGDTLNAARDLGFLQGTQTLNDFVGDVDSNDFYKFELLNDSGFSLLLSGLDANANVSLLDSSGTPIQSLQVDRDTNGLIELELEAGNYFIRVSRNSPELTPYSLQLTGNPLPPPFQIRSISPSRGSSAGESTITIIGNRFTPDANVSLLDDAGLEVVNADVTWLDSETLSATFDLAGLPVDFYDVRVTDTPGTAVAEDIFNVNVGSVGQVEVYLSAPRRIRPFGNDEVTVTYRNVGDTDAVAPLLLLSAENALFQNSDGEYEESEIQFLGIQNEGLAGVLSPGATGSYTVSFKPTAEAGTDINFLVSGVEADGLIDWAALEEEVRPDYISVESWDTIYNNFAAEVGTTGADYQALLVENANYLSQLGEYVQDADRLLSFEFQQASDYQTLAQRNSLGSFGRGRSFIGDIRAVVDDEGDVSIQNTGSQRLFELQPDGSYRGETGDFATLVLVGSVYQLREQDGTLVSFRMDGQLDFIQDTNGNRVSADYTDGALTSLMDSFSNSLTFNYNPQGFIETIADQAGRTTTYTYQVDGYLETVTNEGGTTTYTYYENGATRSITDPNGSQINFEYDEQGRFAQQSLNDGTELITFNYDSAGGVTLTDADGNQTQLALNDRGQVSRITDPDGRIVQFNYDDDGNLSRLIGPDDNTVNAFIYDDEGNLRSQVDALGQRVDFAYEPNFNRLANVRDPRGNSLGYGYDDDGNLRRITYVDGSFEQFDYDPQGNVIEFINRRGQRTIYDYEDGQLVAETLPDSTSTTYRYDPRGNLTSVIDAQGETTLDYDPADRLTKITYPSGRFLIFDYDDGGRRSRLEDQDGFVTNYIYDVAGRLERLTDSNNELIVQYVYDAVGRLARENKGNGTFSVYNYYPTGQVRSITHHAPDSSINAQMGYTYDALGREASMTTLDGEWTYNYDATGQLTQALFASTNPDIPNQDLTYIYDAAGNRIRTIENGVTTEYTTNNLNQYESAGDTTFEYDLDGNLRIETTSEGVRTYDYDSQNRLIRVTDVDGTETSYEYDAFRNRTATVHDGERTEYLVDPFGLGNVIGEYDNNGIVIENYVHGRGLESQISANGSVNYYDFNAIGSTVSLTGSTGEPINNYIYSPFGVEISESESVSNSFEFVGQFGVTEESNGLDFMRARFYNSGAGRFNSSDPIGMVSANRYNLYNYANNNPIALADPSGLLPNISIEAEVGGTIAPNPYVIGGFFGGGIGLGINSCGQVYAKVRRSYGLATGVYAGINTGISVGINSSPLERGWSSSRTARFEGNAGRGGAVGSAIEVDFDGGLSVPKPLPKRLEGKLGYGYGVVVGAGISETEIYTFKNPIFPFNNRFFSYCSLSTDLPNLPLPPNSEISRRITSIVASFDPNDIIGPSGFGPEGWISPPQLLPYTIRFENEAEQATAPAVRVQITHQLDTDLDYSTFELGDFGFGDIEVNVPDGFQNYSQRLDLRDTVGGFVDFTAEFDTTTGEVIWTLETIDPETGELATGVDDGFLPPNTDGDGEGFVRYSIEPQVGLATGTEITAVADIVFDFNAPIRTDSENPAPLNTIDIGAPDSTVNVLPITTTTTDFEVSWTGTDDGSGIDFYDIYVSVDGNPFTLWLDNTEDTSAIYSGVNGSSYSFYSVAEDNVGHIESAPTTAQASTTVDASNVPLANFLGADVQLQVFSPNRDTQRGPSLLATVGSGIEFSVEDSDNPGYQIDFTESSILYQTGSTPPGPAGFAEAEFNGFVLTDIEENIPAIRRVTIDDAETTLGVEASDITFTDDTIAINVEGITYTPGEAVKLDVAFAPPDDSYERNDTLEDSYDLSSSEGIFLSALSGLATQSDDDWYRVNVLPGRNVLAVDLQFSHSDGNIDLELYDANGAFVASSASATDNEFLNEQLPTAGTYYIRVFGFDGDTDNSYDLRWNSSFSDDNYEENDGSATAYDLTGFEGVGLSNIDGLGVQADDDWYRIDDLSLGSRLTVDLQFDHGRGDIDLELFNAGLEQVGSATSVTDNERLDIDLLESGTYYLRVYGFGGNTNSPYDLQWSVA